MTSTDGLPASRALASYLRPPVSPRRNVEDFPPVVAKFIRFEVFKTNLGEPCLDELEVYSAKDPTRNLALVNAGARATASGFLPGYQIHQVAWVNDGLYGNGHSWIGDRTNGAWVQIELPEATPIGHVVWSRDREGFFMDRLALEYVIKVSTNGIDWHNVASSSDRVPPSLDDLSVPRSPMIHTVNPASSINGAMDLNARTRDSEYRIDHWQTEDGLPDNTVTAILQTQDGYLWIATLGGLVRFNGTQFKRYGVAEGLQSERVLCLYEDRQSRLWVGTEGGGLFCLQNGRFSSWTTQNGLSSDVVMAVTQDASNRLWIGTYAGLDCWRDGRFIRQDLLNTNTPEKAARSSESNQLSASREPWRLPPRNPAPVSRVEIDANGGLWSVLGNRLFNVVNGHYVMPTMEGEPSGQNAIGALHAGPSGLWFGGISGYLASLSHKKVVVVPLPSSSLSSDTIMDVCEAHNRDVWMGMASTGLRRWRKGAVLSLTTEEGLADNSVRCLLEDREGNLWVGTSHGGLNRLKPKKLQLKTTLDGLSHNVVMSLAEDSDGDVWGGSNGGGLSKQNGSGFTSADLSYLLDNECIYSLLKTTNGDLWVGTSGSGLIRKVGAKVTQFNITRQWDDEPILALCENRSGGLWVGTYQDGLKFFKDGEFTSYRTTNGLSANYITTLAQDEKGRLWIGTGGGGLNCYSNGVFRALSSKDGLASNFIRTLYVDADGVLWVGTSGGLSRVKDGQIDTFTSQEGLWDDVISQILDDGAGQLWFGSNRGIFRVHKKELEAVAEHRMRMMNSLVFGKGDGLENLECTGGFCPAGLRTRDGRLFFSTVKGLAIVDPKNIPRNDLPPPVLVEEVRVNGEKIEGPKWHLENPSASGKDSDSAGFSFFNRDAAILKVPPNAQHVEFHYAALSFTAPEKIRFRVRLDGLNSEWANVEGRRVAEYPYLPPGEYRFRVAACNEDGIWSSEEVGLPFICLPAFWQTIWFRLVMLTLTLSLVGWGIKLLVTRRLRRRLAVLQEQHALEKERTRIARDIHDELGTLLTEISLLSEHGQKYHDNPTKIGIDLKRISISAREAVQMTDGIVWAINPRNDSLDHLVNYLLRFAEDFFQLTSIRCRLDVPAQIPQIPISTQHRHHLLMAVKEACNNVARHSGASEVWLRVSLTDKQFSVVVEDNGKGLPANTKSESGDGLINMRQRMADIGGDLELSSVPGQGTRVKFSAPLNELNQLPCS